MLKKSEQENLIVAVNFDSQSQILVEAAIGFCRRSNFSMRLINIIPPRAAALWPGEIYGGLAVNDILDADDAMTRSTAESKLNDIAESLPKDINVSVSAVIDDIASGIMLEAKISSAKLIICGATKGSHWLLPNSLSNVLSLMSKSQIPVLVINEESELVFSNNKFKLLLMDDLSNGSTDSIRNIVDFCSLFENVDIIHTHVSGLTREALSAAVESASAAAHSGIDDNFNTDDVFEILEQKGKNRLQQRVGDLLDPTAEGHKYVSKMYYGNVQEALTTAIAEFSPDIICFGKHHSIHMKPFGIGQVAYGTMLAQKKPLLIAGG